MRGKVQPRKDKRMFNGITPAYAGKSRGICACFPLVQDHPRVCGEKVQPRKDKRMFNGITPRMREKKGVE